MNWFNTLYHFKYYVSNKKKERVSLSGTANVSDKSNK